ncbi:hypothetical protein [Catellatospora sp. NPDC049133]|jgi:hypothetical protein|uniref:hypothetical protein n=1 Tax=Catellatospora sp. NPDC049133 TaxID=3155499 RepID=UPI003402562E
MADPIARRTVVASALLARSAPSSDSAWAVPTRHTAMTMVTGAFLPLMLPTMLSSDKRWSAELGHLTPRIAWNTSVIPVEQQRLSHPRHHRPQPAGEPSATL